MAKPRPALAGEAGDAADPRLHAPAFLRNGDAIRDALRRIFPARGLVLEVASGSGEHIVHIARAFPGLTFQPTDRDTAALASIDAHVAEAGLANVKPALWLDAASADWPVGGADAILCINMVHIAPWAATQGLFGHAARLLPPGGTIALYGPFHRAGIPLAPSNAAFDADLRARDPEWGLRHLDALIAIAAHFALRQIVEMPAHNVFAIFQLHKPTFGSVESVTK